MNKKDLEKIVLESYTEVINEQDNEPGPYKIEDLPQRFKQSIEKRYGKIHPKDFLSRDLDSYFKFDGEDKVTGSIKHKIIRLPSFRKLYFDYDEIIKDIKDLMRSKDVRTDKAARELFELIKTNFRKLQRYLRTERPEQYDIFKATRSLEENINKLLYENLNDLMKEQEPEPEEAPDTDAPEETVLEDSTDIILNKFPTVKAAIIKLQTEDFKDFVDKIDWVSPRPSTFRINLKNGQDYILKWLGDGFEAQIMGKRYYINKINDYQQALDKLTILYQQGPFQGSGEGEGAPEDFDSADTGGGDFPGADAGTGAGSDLETPDDAGGGADLTGEPIDFEEPAEEPEG
tara:strand:+ start:198 stop:1232 length:1035 start_codon:yes stop_codon:yes gene_type:complete